MSNQLYIRGPPTITHPGKDVLLQKQKLAEIRDKTARAKRPRI